MEKRRKLRLNNLMITAFLVFCIPVLGQGINSVNANEIYALLSSNLKKANIHAILEKSPVNLYIKNLDQLTGISADFSEFNKKNLNKSTNVKLYIKNNHSKIVGYIDIYLGRGLYKTLRSEPKVQAISFIQVAHYAELFFIYIKDKYRGHGYSNHALKILHNFLDRIGIDYIPLLLHTDTPHTGKIYHKNGYDFDHKTLDLIYR